MTGYISPFLRLPGDTKYIVIDKSDLIDIIDIIVDDSVGLSAFKDMGQADAIGKCKSAARYSLATYLTAKLRGNEAYGKSMKSIVDNNSRLEWKLNNLIELIRRRLPHHTEAKECVIDEHDNCHVAYSSYRIQPKSKPAYVFVRDITAPILHISIHTLIKYDQFKSYLVDRIGGRCKTVDIDESVYVAIKGAEAYMNRDFIGLTQSTDLKNIGLDVDELVNIIASMPIASTLDMIKKKAIAEYDDNPVAFSLCGNVHYVLCRLICRI